MESVAGEGDHTEAIRAWVAEHAQQIQPLWLDARARHGSADLFVAVGIGPGPDPAPVLAVEPFDRLGELLQALAADLQGGHEAASVIDREVYERPLPPAPPGHAWALVIGPGVLSAASVPTAPFEPKGGAA